MKEIVRQGQAPQRPRPSLLLTDVYVAAYECFHEPRAAANSSQIDLRHVRHLDAPPLSDRTHKWRPRRLRRCDWRERVPAVVALCRSIKGRQTDSYLLACIRAATSHRQRTYVIEQSPDRTSSQLQYSTSRGMLNLCQDCYALIYTERFWTRKRVPSATNVIVVVLAVIVIRFSKY